MASHLGRNPFSSQKDAKKENKKSNSESQPARSKNLGEKLLVDLPVDAFMGTVKAALFVKGLLSSEGKEKK